MVEIVSILVILATARRLSVRHLSVRHLSVHRLLRHRQKSHRRHLSLSRPLRCLVPPQVSLVFLVRRLPPASRLALSESKARTKQFAVAVETSGGLALWQDRQLLIVHTAPCRRIGGLLVTASLVLKLVPTAFPAFALVVMTPAKLLHAVVKLLRAVSLAHRQTLLLFRRKRCRHQIQTCPPCHRVRLQVLDLDELIRSLVACSRRQAEGRMALQAPEVHWRPPLKVVGALVPKDHNLVRQGRIVLRNILVGHCKKSRHRPWISIHSRDNLTRLPIRLGSDWLPLLVPIGHRNQ